MSPSDILTAVRELSTALRDRREAVARARLTALAAEATARASAAGVSTLPLWGAAATDWAELARAAAEVLGSLLGAMFPTAGPDRPAEYHELTTLRAECAGLARDG